MVLAIRVLPAHQFSLAFSHWQAINLIRLRFAKLAQSIRETGIPTRKYLDFRATFHWGKLRDIDARKTALTEPFCLLKETGYLMYALEIFHFQEYRF